MRTDVSKLNANSVLNSYSYLSRAVKVTDFEFRVKLLVSLVETRCVVWCKADDVH